MLLEELFFEIGLVLIIAGFLALLVFRLRQPLIIAYLITGLIVGPGVLALAENSEIFDVMSEIGVAFLLFTVGLGLNWKNIKDVGGIAFATGIGQVLFTTIVGFVLATILGFDATTSIYLAVAFAFSSTIIIIKMLMDKEDLDMLYGRISVGFLLVQDFIAMLILLVLGAVASGGSVDVVLIEAGIKGLLVVPILWFVSTRIVPILLDYVARSQELLFVFSIAWCFLIAGFLVYFGFGVELGALLAGLTLSGSFYVREIDARVRPLRDFFLIIFFIVLGTRLELTSMSTMILPTILFSAFILIGNPLIVMIIMRSLGYHPRTGFLSGTTVAQISEFSFIVIIAGITAGHITNDVLGLSAAVGLITIAGSSYLIEHNEKIYQFLHPYLRRFEPEHILGIEKKELKKQHKVILLGVHDSGVELLKVIKKLKQSYMLVDFDPQVIRQLAEAGENPVYGDVGDDNFLEEINADRARLVISTIPNFTTSISLLAYLKTQKYTGISVVSVRNQEEAAKCYELGASYVIIPSVLSGKKFSEILRKNRTSKKSWDLVKHAV